MYLLHVYIMNIKSKNKHHYPRSRDGFTLMELLVVIAIILLLAGLLLPAIHKSREKGRQAHCMNNLRQFAIGINLYRQEHDFNNPPWLSSLYPSYIATKKSYLCKTDKSRGIDGSKPDHTKADIGSGFPKTDDNNDNLTATNRNTAISVCSYMYEFTDARLDSVDDEDGWTWKDYLGDTANLTDTDVDKDGDTSFSTWKEVKRHQLANGDDDNSHQAYDETLFPIVRCFQHVDMNEVEGTDNDLHPLTLNVAYAGNVYRGPTKWELTK